MPAAQHQPCAQPSVRGQAARRCSLPSNCSGRPPPQHSLEETTIQHAGPVPDIVLTEVRERLAALFGTTEFLVLQGTVPNDLSWADFEGEFKLGNGRYCFLLTISDHASRILLL